MLAYAAQGEGCPSTAEFVREVRSYTSHWRIVPEGTPHARTIDIRILTIDGGARGSLTAKGPEEQTSTRILLGPSCAAVAEGLEVMVAVAIDPYASDVKHDAPDTDAPPPPVPPAPSPPRAPGTALRDNPPSRARMTIDFRNEVNSAVVGKALFGVGVAVDIEPSDANTRLGPFRPSIAVGVRQTLPRSTVLAGGSVTFVWSAAQLRLCPFRLPVASARLEIATCAETNLGALQARAHEYAEARDVTLFWADVGGSAWIKASLGRRWFVETTVLADFPLQRRSVELASGTVIARTPAFGMLGGIGVGARF